MRDELQREVVLLNEALALPEDERNDFLDRACAGDLGLRAQVQELLDAHRDLGGFLETVGSGSGGAESAPIPRFPGAAHPGDWVGPYQVLETLGEGGCGVVYLAEQRQPIQRRVALKIIKLGMDTKAVMARFDAERQALALMDHPNIARVLDAGSTAQGRPYFVMEWVRGVSITRYCDTHGLGLLERLELFCCVCRAIQHAHQKGVIHRDVKPSNILVAPSDRGHEVKVIDFGIAKATQGRLTDQTVFTAAEMFLGTPAYMSPEQTVPFRDDVDTRTDVYSLGVLLYELLTGDPPFDPGVLARENLDGMRRIICDVEPERPSVRIRRAPERGRERLAIDPDLDWIVMKCLEKDRSRRYGTANGLVADVERFMGHEPVLAHPPRVWYRLQKMARRHRWAFALGGIALVVLLTLVVGSMIAVWHVSGARKAEQQERQRAEVANRKLLETVRLLELERAESLMEEDPSLGVAQLAAVLREDPSHFAAANRLVSALAHRNWAVALREPMRHLGPVTWVEFSPDGSLIVSASKDGSAVVRETRGPAVRASVRHRGEIFQARFSPDGTCLATGSADGSARLWNVADGSPRCEPLRHEGKVVAVEFSPDGLLLLTASEDRTARLWDTRTGVPKQTFVGHSRPIVSARFSPDGQSVATANASGGLRIWSVATGQVVVQMNHRAPIHSMDFSPDGKRLVVGYDFGNAKVWDVERGVESVPELAHSSERIPVWHVAFNAEGTRIFTGGEDGTGRIWDVASGQPIGPRLKHAAGVVHASFSRDGRSVVTASSDNTSRVWDVETGLPLTQPLRDYERVVRAVFSPDAALVATASSAWNLKIWDIQPRRDAGTQFEAADDLRAVRFAHSGTRLLAGGKDAHVRIGDTLRGERLGTAWDFGKMVEGIAMHPNGRTFTAILETNVLWLHETKEGAPSAGPFVHPSEVTAVAFSPNSNQWSAACRDGTILVWSVDTTNCIASVKGHKRAVLDVQFSHDGRSLATASEDWSACVWAVDTLEPRTEFMTHLDHVRAVRFSPDDRLVLTSSTDNTASLWEADSGKRHGVPFRHSRTVERGVFSPDGKLIATASLDRTVRVWDVTSGSPVTPALVHETPVVYVEFSPDGRRIFSAARNAARLWDPTTGRPLTEWLRISGGIIGAEVDSGGIRFAAAARRAYVWTVPCAPLPVPESFIRVAEHYVGLRLDARGNLELLPWKPVERHSETNPELGVDSFYGPLATWLQAAPVSRSASPF